MSQQTSEPMTIKHEKTSLSIAYENSFPGLITTTIMCDGGGTEWKKP